MIHSRPVMMGVLFDGLEVDLDPRSVEYGAIWGTIKDGKAQAWDQPLIRFFHGQLAGVEAPVLVDVGASVGTFCLLAKFVSLSGLCVFEPNPDAFAVLKENLALNGLAGQARCFDCALSDGGAASLKVPTDPRDSGLATLGQPLRFSSFNELEIEIRRLDDVVDESGLTRLDFLKLDTEGAELLVLKGAEQTLLRFRPKLLLEFYAPNTRQFGYEPGEIIEYLKIFGYERFENVGKEDLWAT